MLIQSHTSTANGTPQVLVGHIRDVVAQRSMPPLWAIHPVRPSVLQTMDTCSAQALTGILRSGHLQNRVSDLGSHLGYQILGPIWGTKYGTGVGTLCRYGITR